MLQRAKMKPSLALPADIDTALAQPEWRRSVSWPVGLGETNRICVRQVRDALAWTRQLDDPLMRDAASLALPVLLAYGRAIVLAALAIERANRKDARIAGAAAEIEYLQTGDGPLPVRSDPILAPARFNLSYARRIARMRSWTPLARVPRALVSPRAVAIGHNPLLRAVAREERGAIGFRHAETILDAVRRKAVSVVDVSEASRALASVIIDSASLSDRYRGRALQLVEAVVQNHVGKAMRDLTALRSASLPSEVWTGSGGLYAPRAIGIEVLRRGGRVRRFDHGTPREFVATPEITALLELSVSSEFTLATQGAADICRAEMSAHGPAGDRDVTISGADGDPVFRRAPARRGHARSGRPRVVYAPTLLLGFRQLVPALPPDAVHLDWQMRVAEFLRALPVEFVCQAHPEGLFLNRPHPLEAVVPTLRGNFGAQLEKADVFVFDYPTTTALWEATCTDARIVYLDMGAGRMTPDVARAFAKRATIVPVMHSDDHRMTFDADALRDAVLTEGAQADPMEFRRLLAGDV
jgi:hypothetical protein